jgi:hypothetical protein
MIILKWGLIFLLSYISIISLFITYKTVNKNQLLGNVILSIVLLLTLVYIIFK